MRYFSKISGVLILSFILSGCSSLPPFNFSAKNIQISKNIIKEDLKSITVGIAHPDEKTGSIDSGTHLTLPAFKEALTEAIDKAAIFRDNAQTHVNLQATIMKMDTPTFGATMETDMECRYNIVDRDSGNSLFSENIASKGKVPMGFSWLGAIRARESANRAFQNNISLFIDKLENSSIAESRNADVVPQVSNSDQNRVPLKNDVKYANN